MGFVIGVLAALIVTFLLGYITVKKPFFGGVLISISLLIIVLSIFFYFQEDSRLDKKKQLITVDQVELSDINYGFAYGNNYKLTANIRNLSARFRLQSILLKISFFQCNETEENIENCQLVFEKQHEVVTRLAAEQSAKIETYLQLDDPELMHNKDSLRWQVKLISAMAR